MPADPAGVAELARTCERLGLAWRLESPLRPHVRVGGRRFGSPWLAVDWLEKRERAGA